MSDDYYTVLGVARTASQTDIRTAYRKLAKTWHPDRNLGREQEATRKFAQLSEAYEVLSDERKKQIYDLGGRDGLMKNSGSRTFKDPEDIFKAFFGDDDFMNNDGFFSSHDDPLRSSSSSYFSSASGPASTNMFYNTCYGIVRYFVVGTAYIAYSIGYSLPRYILRSIWGGSDSSNSGMPSSFSSPNVRSTSTTVEYSRSGKKMTTEKVNDYGVVTVTIFEDDVPTSRTVDGVSQSLS